MAQSCLNIIRVVVNLWLNGVWFIIIIVIIIVIIIITITITFTLPVKVRNIFRFDNF